MARRVQQNSGALISSLFCRREKILDGCLLWFLGFFSLISKASGLSVLHFPHGMSFLRVLQRGKQAALSINPTLRINNRDLCKEKNSYQLLRKHLNSFRDMQAKRETAKCIKKPAVSESAGSQNQPNPASRCFSCSENLHRGAWAPAQSWVLSSKNLTSSFRRAAAPGKSDFIRKEVHPEKCPSHDLVQWQYSWELSCKNKDGKERWEKCLKEGVFLQCWNAYRSALLL